MADAAEAPHEAQTGAEPAQIDTVLAMVETAVQKAIAAELAERDLLALPPNQRAEAYTLLQRRVREPSEASQAAEEEEPGSYARLAMGSLRRGVQQGLLGRLRAASRIQLGRAA